MHNEPEKALIMEEYLHEISRIKEALEQHPDGLSITDIAGLLQINRNSVAKYMDILQIQGSVDGKKRGTSKVYYLSHRLAVDSLRKICSQPVCNARPERPGHRTQHIVFYPARHAPGADRRDSISISFPFRFEGEENARQVFRMAFKGHEQHVHASLRLQGREYPG